MNRGAHYAFLALVFAGPGHADEESADSLVSSALPERREEGAAALGKQGDVAATKRLIKMLDDKDWGVRVAALHALGPLQNKDG